MRLTVARVNPTRAAIAPCLMPSRASANPSCLIPKVVTVWRLIWGNDHLYCGFGARRSHLTLHWMSAQGSVGFRWGTITGPYHANFSQVETQKFDPHWFYCLQWGCNNLFCQECSIFNKRRPLFGLQCLIFKGLIRFESRVITVHVRMLPRKLGDEYHSRLIPYGPLTTYVILRDAHAPGMPGMFSPPPRVSDPGMHHGTSVAHMPWCMPGLLISVFLWSRWWGKCSRHSRGMRNLQFYVSGKTPIHKRGRVRFWETLSGVLWNFTHSYAYTPGVLFTKRTDVLPLKLLNFQSRSHEIGIIIVSLWNLTGISAVLLPRCLSNFEAIGKV